MWWVVLVASIFSFVGGLLVGRKKWAGKFVGQIGDAVELPFKNPVPPAVTPVLPKSQV